MGASLDQIPSGESLDRCRSIKLLTKENKATTFGEVIRDRRTVVIFIRHWFCITCQSYIKAFSREFPSSKLPPGTGVVIVGCGGAHPIEMYYRITNCPREYEIYAEPTRTIHNAQHFDFVTSTAMSQPGQQKTEYIKDLGPKWRQVGAMVKSAAAGPANLPYAGNPAQNGGEFIFEADGTCTYAHRMQHAGDHSEVKKLAMELAKDEDR